MPFSDFHEMPLWKDSLTLCRTIYRLTAKPPIKRDFHFIDQWRRASLSIMNNIAEGFGRGGNKEFVNFLGIARGSCSEVRSMAFLAYELSYLSKDDFQDLMEQSSRIQRMLGGFMKYLKRNDFKGFKFK